MHAQDKAKSQKRPHYYYQGLPRACQPLAQESEPTMTINTNITAHEKILLADRPASVQVRHLFRVRASQLAELLQVAEAADHDNGSPTLGCLSLQADGYMGTLTAVATCGKILAERTLARQATSPAEVKPGWLSESDQAEVGFCAYGEPCHSPEYQMAGLDVADLLLVPYKKALALAKEATKLARQQLKQGGSCWLVVDYLGRQQDQRHTLAIAYAERKADRATIQATAAGHPSAGRLSVYPSYRPALANQEQAPQKPDGRACYNMALMARLGKAMGWSDKVIVLEPHGPKGGTYLRALSTAGGQTEGRALIMPVTLPD